MTAPTAARDAWNALAAGYDEWVTPRSRPVAEDALARLGLQAGDRFLDVGAGTGALATAAARLGAHVLATDIAPAMLDQLEARARRENLPRIETRVMDGEALEFDDGAFDAAGSQGALMLFPDPTRGLGELVRVTRPGGRVLVVSAGPPERVEYFSFFFGAVQAAVPGLEPPEPGPSPFQLADPAELRRTMADAGLERVDVQAVVHETTFRSGVDLWAAVTSGNPIGATVAATLGDDRRAEVQRVLDGMLRERSGGGAAVLRAQFNVGVGTRRA